MAGVEGKQRWYQFRLRTLLILVTVLAVPLAWLAHERQKVQARNEWLEAMKAQGADIGYVHGPRAQPAWLRTLLGDDSFGDVIRIRLVGITLTDAELVHLIGLAKLEILDLKDSQITEARRQKLRQALPNLRIYLVL